MADGTSVVNSEVVTEALQNIVKVGRNLLDDAEKDIAQGNCLLTFTTARTLAVMSTLLGYLCVSTYEFAWVML